MYQAKSKLVLLLGEFTDSYPNGNIYRAKSWQYKKTLFLVFNIDQSSITSKKNHQINLKKTEFNKNIRISNINNLKLNFTN